MQYSIIRYQAVKTASHSFRFDAEFFHPYYLKIQAVIENKKYKKLKDFGVSIYHPKEIKRSYVDNGVLFFRTQNVRPLAIDTSSNPVFISTSDAEKLERNYIKYKDVLLTRTGVNFGQTAIYLNNTKAIASSHVFIIHSGNLNPFFLSVFFNTKHGKIMIDKGMYGGVQPEVAPYFLYQTPIPIFDNLETLIETVYRQSQNLKEQSHNRYQQAQTLLLSELGLTHWQPKHQLTFIKNYSDTKQAGRIDAEYFQPKYEAIEKAIKSYSRGYSFIGSEFKQNKSTFHVNDEKQYKYIEIGCVNVSNGEIIPNEVLGSKLPANAKRILRQNDVIISKVRTYRGAATIIEKSGFVGSSAFTVLSENGCINKETLFAFIHSKPLLAWSLKPNTGTSYPVIVDDDIMSLPIPILPKSKQTQIKQKITESFDLRKQSRHLLECAKRAVEIAIEQDEQTAIQWLQNETGEM